MNNLTSATLLDAAEKGDLNAVKDFLAAGVDINVRNSFEETPLFLASRYSHIEVVSFLLDQNADVHAVNSGGQNALHAVCVGGSVTIMEKLLAAGIDQTKITSKIKPISFAIKYANIDIVKNFVSHGLLNSAEIKNIRFDRKKTKTQITQTLDALILGQPSFDNETADKIFAGFITANNLVGMKYMLAKFPEIKMRLNSYFDNLLCSLEFNDKQATLLQSAKIKSNVLRKYQQQIFAGTAKNPALKFLLTQGLTMDMQDSHGQTLLHYAAEYQNDEYEDLSILKVLLDMEYPVDVINVDGQTPLQFAIQKAMFFHALYLIYRGANVNHVDQAGRSVLDYAKAFCPDYWQPDDPQNIEFRSALIQLLQDYGAVK